MSARIHALLFLLIAATVSQALPLSGHAPYPDEWWAPVPREQAKGWEVLPQDAGPGEVVLSKRNELGVFSNFAATPFVYDGKTYASVEGFWQMLKYPEGPDDERLKDPSIQWPFTRDQVAAMTAYDAKAAGNKANALMNQLGIDWVTFKGKKIQFLENAKGEYYNLIYAVEMAKMNQNQRVKDLLKRTGALKLLPDHHQSADAPPAWKYYEIWMELRSQI
jgi:predicted NAD-dependent protein-ADP-ribosyltransferase YbiA (DUF1768 family)